MQDDQDRPTTETAATSKPPRGENVKDLVTPGGDSDAEADAEEERARANPAPNEAPEEEQSPT